MTNLWRDIDDHSLFPSHIEYSEKEGIYFELMGSLIAKGISDSRLIDLPFSPLFWELVLGKVPQFADYAKIDLNLYKSITDL